MSDTVSCPYCRNEIYEDSVRCPRCGNYISEEDSPPSRKPMWLAITAIICLVLIFMWMGLGRFIY
jgi:uncharacterized paraquat-inducible protein A